jgi:hypothetical protein
LWKIEHFNVEAQSDWRFEHVKVYATK